MPCRNESGPTLLPASTRSTLPPPPRSQVVVKDVGSTFDPLGFAFLRFFVAAAAFSPFLKVGWGAASRRWPQALRQFFFAGTPRWSTAGLLPLLLPPSAHH